MQHLARVLAEAGRAGGCARRLADVTRERRLLPDRTDDRIVDRHEVGPLDHVRVGEDVGRRVGGRDGNVARDAAFLDVGRVERRGPLARRCR